MSKVGLVPFEDLPCIIPLPSCLPLRDLLKTWPTTHVIWRVDIKLEGEVTMVITLVEKRDPSVCNVDGDLRVSVGVLIDRDHVCVLKEYQCDTGSQTVMRWMGNLRRRVRNQSGEDVFMVKKVSVVGYTVRPCSEEETRSRWGVRWRPLRSSQRSRWPCMRY